MKLLNCSIIINEDDALVHKGDNITCQLQYPSNVFIVILNTDEHNTQIVDRVTGDPEFEWFWILLLVLVSVGVSGLYLGMKKWQNIKMIRAAKNQQDMDVNDTLIAKDSQFM